MILPQYHCSSVSQGRYFLAYQFLEYMALPFGDLMSYLVQFKVATLLDVKIFKFASLCNRRLCNTQ